MPAAGTDPLPGSSGERAKGSLIPEAGTISVLVPVGQMCSRCQGGQKGALIIFSSMTPLLHLHNLEEFMCVCVSE